MLEPIEFRILQNLQAALKAIRVSAGYHHNVEEFAVKMDPDHEVEDLIGGADAPLGPPRPFVVLELAPDEFEYFPANQVRLRMPGIIHAIHNSDTTDDDSKLKTYHRLCADVEKAIATDITRGALATDTRISSRQMRERDRGGSEVWALLAFEIREHRTYGAANG